MHGTEVAPVSALVDGGQELEPQGQCIDGDEPQCETPMWMTFRVTDGRMTCRPISSVAAPMNPKTNAEEAARPRASKA